MADSSFSEARPLHTRRILTYTAPGRSVKRGIHTSADGRPEIIAEAGDVLTVRLDFARLMDVDEIITEATATPINVKADFVRYDGQTAYLSITNPNGTGFVNVTIKTSNSERFTDRIMVRLPDKSNECASVNVATFRRGAL